MKSSAEVGAFVRAKVRLRHFALSTEEAYCSWTARSCKKTGRAWIPA